MARPSLIVTEGPARGATLVVPAGGLVLGRTVPGAAGLGGDTALSRRHAELGWTTDGALYVRDVGSRNGTFVEGERIAGLHVLHPGETLQVGHSVLEVVGEEVGGDTMTYGLPGTTTGGDVRVRGDVRADRGAVAAGRDIHGGVHTRYELDASGLGILTRTRGPARVLLFLGTLLAFAGIGSMGYPVVAVITEEFGNVGADESDAAVEECRQRFPGDDFESASRRNDCIFDARAAAASPDFEARPWIPLGAVLFAAGALLTLVGTFAIRRAPDD